MSAQSSSRPAKHIAIAHALRARIRSGSLVPGDRLPSLAKLQSEYSISEDTAERVYALLEQEGLAVRRHRSGTFVAPAKPQKQLVIGISGVGFSYVGSSYWTHLLQGIEEVASQAGAQIALLGVESSQGWEKADGILVCDWSGNEHTNFIPPQFPSVSVLVPTDRISSVAADDAQGVYMSARHLLSLGHRKISYLHTSDRLLLTRRLAGFYRALREANIEPELQWERTIPERYDFGNRFILAGKHHMRAWLSDGWRDSGSTAILTQNDETAIGVIEALQEVGLRVPEDVSVVGFDGTESYDFFSPQLTTVQLPMREIGATAARLLLNQIKADAPCVEHKLLPVSFKPGASTGPVTKYA